MKCTAPSKQLKVCFQCCSTDFSLITRFIPSVALVTKGSCLEKTVWIKKKSNVTLNHCVGVFFESIYQINLNCLTMTFFLEGWALFWKKPNYSIIFGVSQMNVNVITKLFNKKNQWFVTFVLEFFFLVFNQLCKICKSSSFVTGLWLSRWNSYVC